MRKDITAKKVIAISFILILVINMVLLALKKIDYKIFWMIIVVAFGVSYLMTKTEDKYG